MHEPHEELGRRAGFAELRGEFNGHFRDLRTAVVKQRGSGTLDHVHLLGLPLLGRTHASIGNGQIHVAAVLGLRLAAPEDPDGRALELVKGGMEAEAYRCCQLIEQVLRSCHGCWGDLARLTVYVPDLTANKLEAVERVVDFFFKERQCHPVTKTAVGCSRLRLSASVQMEAVALPADPRPLQMPPPPGLEESPEVPLPPGLEKSLEACEPLCASGHSSPGHGATSPEPEPAPQGPPQTQWTMSTVKAEDIVEADGEPTPTSQPQKGAWVVVEALQEPQVSGPPPGLDVKETPKFSALGFVGQLSAVRLAELSVEEVKQQSFRFQAPHDRFCRVEMLGNKAYRTVRLHPGSFVCNPVVDDNNMPAGQWTGSSVWSYTFDVAVVRTTNSFVNIGLVEWITAAQPPRAPAEGERTLAELLGVCPEVPKCAWQHTSENPRQMMLGCRKGVKWYGNSSWDHLFKDDLCEGTVLQFHCEICLGARHETKHMRLWLLPSPVVFRRRGPQVVQIARPLLEWTLPALGSSQAEPRTCSLWVPAVTLFSQEDTVVFAWRRGAGATA